MKQKCNGFIGVLLFCVKKHFTIGYNSYKGVKKTIPHKDLIMKKSIKTINNKKTHGRIISKFTHKLIAFQISFNVACDIHNKYYIIKLIVWIVLCMIASKTHINYSFATVIFCIKIA